LAEHLGEFELIVLLAVLRLGDEAYGLTIRRELARHAHRTVSAGAVYTALARMEQRSLVESWLGEPTSERGGRAKRYYRVRPAGEQAVRRTHAALRSLGRDLGRKFGSI
jgi:PadR family transcriptional regulator PadR